MEVRGYELCEINIRWTSDCIDQVDVYMEDKIEDFLSCCSQIDFGAVNLSDTEKEFYNDLNREIILLCKSLPESTQVDALMFLMRYSRTPFGEELNFFRNYYVPAWSIIYWLIRSGPDVKGLVKKDIKNAITAHSMAMTLHSLDDHLRDGELPVTHLTLLLRSQSWMKMKNTFHSLAHGVDRGEKIVEGFIDDYYSGICSSEEIGSLDSYCDLFRRQMATGLIAPFLLSKKMTGNENFTGDIQTAYGSFGVAWRLLDDINDIEKDMIKSIHSAVYLSLPQNIKSIWDKHKGEELNKNNGFSEIILNYIMKDSVINRIMKRICSELESASSIADHYNLSGLADEFRSLEEPLKNRLAPL